MGRTKTKSQHRWTVSNFPTGGFGNERRATACLEGSFVVWDRRLWNSRSTGSLLRYSCSSIGYETQNSSKLEGCDCNCSQTHGKKLLLKAVKQEICSNQRSLPPQLTRTLLRGSWNKPSFSGQSSRIMEPESLNIKSLLPLVPRTSSAVSLRVLPHLLERIQTFGLGFQSHDLIDSSPGFLTMQNQDPQHPTPPEGTRITW